MVTNDSIKSSVTGTNAISHSCALFEEADRLNDQAYAVLEEPFSTQTMHKFSEARKRADELYRQAWQEWQYSHGGTAH